MSTVSTHVLDTSLGTPASGIEVTLERGGTALASGITDGDGRLREWRTPVALDAGTYTLSFDVAAYFTASGRDSFYPRITVSFTVRGDAQHYHVPLLLSPFGYSTYRGS